ncbi:MAG: DNA-formamidopyrimidine glycosylase family protein, partial [bacterium]|nr:DNA-formamidopyrimidine glycosylase family protein [bacterium]
WIVLKLSSGEYFLFHLMMTGKLLLNPKNESKHDRLILYLSGNTKLVFNDIRKFGKCRITDSLKNLAGQDALQISFPDFKKLITVKNRNIKIFLLDQKHIAGIGNIYADEILWEASIHPLQKTNTLKHFEILKLFKSIKRILRLAIKKGGTSSRDYRKPDNTEGQYYKIRKVYQRTGESCAKCGGIIQRIVVGGRSTHFCPKHQK